MEYADVGAIGKEALNETAFAANLRNVDALAHVVRVFEDARFHTSGEIDPLRDIKNIDFDLIVNDLGQMEKRLERVEKDLKKMKSPESKKSTSCSCAPRRIWERKSPLREMEMTPEDKKRVRGFMFLSEKPILYVLNIGESTELGKELEEAVGEIQARRNRLTAEHRGDRDLRQSRGRTRRDER